MASSQDGRGRGEIEISSFFALIEVDRREVDIQGNEEEKRGRTEKEVTNREHSRQIGSTHNNSPLQYTSLVPPTLPHNRLLGEFAS